MAVVTYLLGAGASANCLPVVNKMAEDLKEVIIKLEREYLIFDFFGHGSENIELKQIITPLIKELQNLRAACETHYPVDTYAKKLFLTNTHDFQKLKVILSFYFTYKQLIKEADVRYDNFWASILDNQARIPSKIKMLSWNYDFQVELSYMKMTIRENLDLAQDMMHMITPMTPESKIKQAGFVLFKVNGTARFKEGNADQLNYLTEHNKNQSHPEKIEQLVSTTTKILETPSNYEMELKFAWENDGSKLMSKEFINFYKDTQIVAIIGYSFPFFNRAIDRLIFRNMPGLFRIYIQDKDPESIAERLREIETIHPTVEIIPVRNTDQFVFPKELEV